MRKIKTYNFGFALMEVLVGVFIFSLVAYAVYGSYTSLIRLANNSQARTGAVQLAAEQFEIIRNMPYSKVGLTSGIPQGVLPQNQSLTRGGITYNVLLTIRNINLSTSTVQASDKLVEIEVDCDTCQNFEPVVLTGQVAPANLQSAGTGGALVTQVFNGNGEPVQGATVYLQNVATTSITNTDVTNNSGILNVIGIPPGVNNYKIIVSKDGYSTEQTYPVGTLGNPNPTKPHITILNQQVSQASFAIDLLSNLEINSVSPLCSPVGNINFDLKGAKNIGVDLPKYSQSLSTNGSGELSLNNMEWDTYTLTPTDSDYDFAGINPDSPFSLNPGSSQSLQLVVVPRNTNSLLLSIQDNASKLPLSGATVTLSKTGFSQSKITGKGYLKQTDWSGGSGQDLLTDLTRYYADNGNVDVATSSGDIVLRQVYGLYDINTSGILESSVFDTGTSSNYYNISWAPINQPLVAGENSVRLQFASSASSSGPWNYLGPDGTSDTFYTVPESSIHASNNEKRYARYKVFLKTLVSTSTPTISDIQFSYTSECIPPGQVLFQGLGIGTYNINVTKSGYSDYVGSFTVGNGWQKIVISMEAI